jgi:hypothetical protein
MSKRATARAMNGGPEASRLLVPGPVRGASALLRVQAAIWGLVWLVMFFQTSPSLAGQYGIAEVLLTVVGLAVPGGFAAGSLHLAARLTRPGGRRVRIEVIGLESFMACFGLAIFILSLLGGASSAGTAGLAGLIGAGLSGAAAGGLLGADARHYCDARLPNRA